MRKSCRTFLCFIACFIFTCDRSLSAESADRKTGQGRRRGTKVGHSPPFPPPALRDTSPRRAACSRPVVSHSAGESASIVRRSFGSGPSHASTKSRTVVSRVQLTRLAVFYRPLLQNTLDVFFQNPKKR